MKTRIISLLVFLCLGCVPGLRAQSFDGLWKQVEQAEKQSRPQTVIRLAEEIYRKGEAERNSPQMIKAAVYRMKYQEQLTPDSFYVNMERLERWARSADEPLDRAVLHSLIAEKYAEYTVYNRWELNRGGEIVGAVPEDMREWTARMFVDTVRWHVREAVADSALLLRSSSAQYAPFVEQGEQSESYHHDMYHLLAMRSISSLRQVRYMGDNEVVWADIGRLYGDMLSAYRGGGEEKREALLLTALSYLEWKCESTSTFILPHTEADKPETEPYFVSLDSLREEYKDMELCAEVYLAQARYLDSRGWYAEALRLCDEAIRSYPDFKGIDELKYLRESILLPSLNVISSSAAYPDGEVRLFLEHRNLKGFRLQLLQGKKTVLNRHFDLIPSEEYQREDTTFTFKAPSLGEYTLRVVPDTVPKYLPEDGELHVTRLMLLSHDLSGNRCRVRTLDRETGHPVPYADILLYGDRDSLIRKVKTDERGEAIFRWKRRYRSMKAVKGDDVFMDKYFGHYGTAGTWRENTEERVVLLTDRSLYRPGQTVYVKGIVYRQKSDSAQVVQDKEYTVSLIDANNQEIGERELRTNEFGSFATDFTLPSSCLNGMFRLQTKNGSVSFRVEEYKRPTFEVTMEEQGDDYRLGDSVKVKGKVETFSGIALPGLKVKYTVNRHSFRFFRFMWPSWDSRVQIASGEVTTDENGNFSLPVSLREDDTKKGDKEASYSFQVEATVTDAAGETRLASCVLIAGSRSLVVQSDLRAQVCKDSPVKAVFRVENLNRQPVDREGTVRLFPARGDDWTQTDTIPVAEARFVSGRAVELDWSGVPSGRYIWKSFVKNSSGKEETSEGRIILYSSEDKRPPIETPIWIAEEDVKFDLSSPAVLHLGTSEKNAYVMINVSSNDKLLESKNIILTDTVVRIEYPYKESYGPGIVVNVCLVRNGSIYQEVVRIEKRFPKDKLEMRWEVFRDKLRPGQTEEWRLSIKTPDGKAADAEMLATMYDASLDEIWENRPFFRRNYNRYLSNLYWHGGGNGGNFLYFQWEATSYPGYANISEALSGKVAGIVSTPRIRGTGNMKKVTVIGAVSTVDTAVLHEEIVGAAPHSIADAKNAENEGMSSSPSTVPRSNFAETAFFYPQLRTDSNGVVSVSFTLPESLTRWNFRGYAHTRDMMMGTLEDEMTASKEFTLSVNPPRFVRVGDRTSMTASLSNVTGETLSGTVVMTLFDPLTDKTISESEQPFMVASGQTVGVSFPFEADGALEVLGCRMTARSDSFSDGEQRAIPVLGDKTHIVETVPLSIREEGTRRLSLDTLFNRHDASASNRRLTVELTGNPAWYAVQALPSLAQPSTGDAVAWASAYYANTLAAHILNSQLRIKAAFENWKLSENAEETFQSNLQKNQELKSVLLTESPWVLEAQTEEEQKRRIATLFDLNSLQGSNAAVLTRLKDLQNGDGSWPWYKGMGGSRYVTEYVTELLTRLSFLAGKDFSEDALKLRNKAFDFLHKEVRKAYERALKNKESADISWSVLRYLYLVALSGEAVPLENSAAYKHYLSKVKDWATASSSMETKAMAAVVLWKAGRVQDANGLLISLKEHLMRTDERGTFFAFNETSFWGWPARAHVRTMEALSLTGKDDETVEEMKLWLLSRKRALQWDSPISTVDAVYALLMRGTDPLTAESRVRLTIGRETIDTDAPEAVDALGYVKRSFTENKVVNERKARIEKEGAGTAWGAVYAEYDIPIRSVRQHGGGIEVSKALYVERMTDGLPVLTPVTKETVLHPGDKVVSRLTVRTDRTLDFVHLKDSRGAFLEPVGTISGYRWEAGTGYYVDIKDASTNFFLDHLEKGVYVVEHACRVSRTGVYNSGLATVQCAYAPEYAAHSATTTVTVE